MPSSSHIPPTCRSPAESMVMTWRRVGSLTCLNRIAARWLCFQRRPASILAWDVFAGDFVVVGVAVAIGVSPRGFHRPDGGETPPHPREGPIAKRSSETEGRGRTG